METYIFATEMTKTFKHNWSQPTAHNSVYSEIPLGIFTKDDLIDDFLISNYV